MKKLFYSVLFIAVCLLLQAAPKPKAHRIEQIFDKNVKVLHFLPGGGLHGIYDKGQKIDFSMILRSPKSGKAEVETEVLDFDKKKLSSYKTTVPLQANKRVSIRIPMKDPGKFGHFTVNAKVRFNGKLSVISQSGCVIMPPPPAKPDTYFELDGRNPHHAYDMTKAFKRIGVGVLGLNTLNSFHRDPAVCYKSYFRNPKRTRFPKTVGFIALGESRGDPCNAAKLRLSNYFPYTVEYYNRWDKIVETVAKLGKDTVDLWCLVQEVDGSMSQRNFSPAAVMADHIIRVKRFTAILRRIDPGCKIAVMNTCGDNFFAHNFRDIRLLLKETAKYVDYYAIDAYTGTWNGLLSDLEEPEKNGKLKAILKASAKMAAEFQLPPKVIQAERGYYIPYMDALNSPKSINMLNFDARSIIIARGLPEVISYSKIGAAAWARPYDIEAQKLDPEKVVDSGLWRSTYSADKKFAQTPRPSLASYATLLRLLAHVKDPHEVRITEAIYSYTFRRPNGKILAAVWTTDKRTRATFDLPQGTLFHDLMGNTRKLAKGKNTLTITQTPFFLELSGSSRSVAGILRKADFPDIQHFEGAVKTTGINTYALYLKSLSNKDITVRISADKKVSLPGQVRIKAGKRARINFNSPGEVKLTLRAASQRLTLRAPVRKPYFIPYGKTPKHITVIRYPEHVRPLAALRAERHYFRCDGTDITAKLAASYDKEHLYLAFTVKDRTHIQRHGSNSIWQDDCIQFGIDAGNDALPGSLAFRPGFDRKDDYIFGLALPKRGPVFYTWYNGKGLAGLLPYKVKVTRKGEMTHYFCAVPWKAIAPLKGVKGTAFGFNFLVMDNNDPSFHSAPYWLTWTDGIAGRQDPSKFQTFILK